MSPPRDAIEAFFEERRQAIEAMAQDEELRRMSLDWMLHADRYKYTYNYTWMGRPIIKFPNDILVQQELIWSVRPEVIVETGIAHGGSSVFYASMLELLGRGQVIAVDVDIRAHNRRAIEEHPMARRITMIEGDSTDEAVVTRVRDLVAGRDPVMVFLDSNHAHEHVYRELDRYADLVTVGSYCVLPDTFIEFFPPGYYRDRPWDVGNNPLTALRQFLSERSDFEIVRSLSDKAMITEGFDGYLRRLR